MTTEKRNDEIDLIEVFQKMGNGIKNIFNIFLNLLYSILLFFIRKSILIFIIVILGLGFGLFQYKTSPRYYSSSLEASSNAMSSIDMINYINNLNALFLEDDQQTLSKKLNLTLEELEQIKNIKAYKVIDFNKDGVTDLIDYDEKYKTSDTTISARRFVIKVEIYNQDIIPSLQEKIGDFINSNKYITELNIVRKRQLSELINKIDIELNALDSLKKTEYFTKKEKFKTQTGQLLVMNEKTTQLYHPQIMALYKEKQGLEKTLELRTDPITIIQDFSGLSTIENKLTKYIKFYGIVSLAFAIALGIILENKKKILDIISDSKKK